MLLGIFHVYLLLLDRIDSLSVTFFIWRFTLTSKCINSYCWTLIGGSKYSEILLKIYNGLKNLSTVQIAANSDQASVSNDIKHHISCGRGWLRTKLGCQMRIFESTYKIFHSISWSIFSPNYPALISSQLSYVWLIKVSKVRFWLLLTTRKWIKHAVFTLCSVVL